MKSRINALFVPAIIVCVGGCGKSYQPTAQADSPTVAEATALATAAQQTAKTASKYTSNRFGEITFSFGYPENLELKETAANMVAALFSQEPLASFTVSVQDLRDWNLSFVDMDGYMKEYDQRVLPMLVDVERLKREKAKFAGQDAYLTIFTAANRRTPKLTTKYFMYTFVVDKVFAFDVGYAATSEVYETFLPEARKILARFEVARTAPGEWKTYTNNLIGFSIDYPGGWDTNVIPRDLITHMVNHRGESAVVAMTNTEEGKVQAGVVLDTITIGFKDLGNTPMSLCEYQAWDYAESQKLFKDYVKKQDGKDKIAGRECYFAVAERSGLSVKDYVFMDRGICCVLSFNTRPERFEQALPAAERIMKSFRFTGGSQ